MSFARVALLATALAMAHPAGAQEWLDVPDGCSPSAWGDVVRRAQGRVDTCHLDRTRARDAAARRGDPGEMRHATTFVESEACGYLVPSGCSYVEELLCLRTLARRKQSESCLEAGNAPIEPSIDEYLLLARRTWDSLGVVRRRLGIDWKPLMGDVAVSQLRQHLMRLTWVGDDVAAIVIQAVEDGHPSGVVEPDFLLAEAEEELAALPVPSQAAKAVAFALFHAALPASKRRTLTDDDITWSLMSGSGYLSRRELDTFVDALPGSTPDSVRYEGSVAAGAGSGSRTMMAAPMSEAQLAQRRARIRAIEERASILNELVAVSGHEFDDAMWREVERELGELNRELAMLGG